MVNCRRQELILKLSTQPMRVLHTINRSTVSFSPSEARMNLNVIDLDTGGHSRCADTKIDLSTQYFHGVSVPHPRELNHTTRRRSSIRVKFLRFLEQINLMNLAEEFPLILCLKEPYESSFKKDSVGVTVRMSVSFLSSLTHTHPHSQLRDHRRFRHFLMIDIFVW